MRFLRQVSSFLIERSYFLRGSESLAPSLIFPDEYLRSRIEQNAELVKFRETIERSAAEGLVTPTTAAKAMITAMETLLFRGSGGT